MQWDDNERERALKETDVCVYHFVCYQFCAPYKWVLSEQVNRDTLLMNCRPVSKCHLFRYLYRECDKVNCWLSFSLSSVDYLSLFRMEPNINLCNTIFKKIRFFKVIFFDLKINRMVLVLVKLLKFVNIESIDGRSVDET